MPDGSEDVYGSSQINIPPTFPYILKQYAKAAIRTQPYDLLKWSASYFRALAKGETPPIKDRLEYPPPDSPSGLSPGYLKVLIKQIGKGGTVTVSHLIERWNGICLAEEPLHEMLAVGQFGETFDWLHFVAVAAGFLCNNLTQTMVLLCNLLTDEPEGGSALIPFHVFSKLYMFLAGLNCGDPLEDDEDDKREYVLPDGSQCNFPHPHKEELKHTDTSVFISISTLSRIDQILVANDTLNLSPEITPVSTPCHTPPSPLLSGNASSSTLTPETVTRSDTSQTEKEKVSCELIDSEAYGIKKGSSPSNQEIIAGQENIHESKNEKPEETVAESQRGPVIHEELISVLSESHTASSPPKDKNAHGDIHDSSSSVVPPIQESTSKPKMKSERSTYSQHVPGIGPVVDLVQVKLVLDHLKGVSQKQEEMIKPGNIRHFLCPPLEKVPASQKTKV